MFATWSTFGSRSSQAGFAEPLAHIIFAIPPVGAPVKIGNGETVRQIGVDLDLEGSVGRLLAGARGSDDVPVYLAAKGFGDGMRIEANHRTTSVDTYD
jgi:hypothetical protein